MKDSPKYKLIKIFTDEDAKHRGRPIFETIIEFLSSHHCQCRCVVSRAIAGCNEKGHISNRNILTLSTHMPLIIHIIVPQEKFDTVQKELVTMVTEGVITVEDITVLNKQ